MKTSLIFVVIIFGLILFLNGCSNNSELLDDKMILTGDRCSLISDYVFIYQTGCPHCEKVALRLEQVENELNITFKEYNLAFKNDRDEVNRLNIFPKGVPAVIIYCKVYIGDRYSVNDYKNAVNSV